MSAPVMNDWQVVGARDPRAAQHLIRRGRTVCGVTASSSFIDRSRPFCETCAAVPAGHFVQSEVLHASGLTYRQLDHWCRIELLRPVNPDPGTGVRRAFPPAEMRVAVTMARLVRAGLTVDAAHTVARGGQLPENVQVRFVVPKPEEVTNGTEH